MIYIIYINREIKRVVSGLRVTYVYTVKQYGNLLKVTSAYTYIGLGAHRSALAHIHAYRKLDYIID